jgi:DNA-binding IclR family transcriptional regulator
MRRLGPEDTGRSAGRDSASAYNSGMRKDPDGSSRPPVLNSVNNALRVLDYLVEHGEGGVSEMGREFGLSPGTVYRLVSTLVQTGFADQNGENRKYVPGTKILELANSMRSRVEFLDLAHLQLGRLMERSQETVNFGVMRGDDVVYVDRVLSRQPLGVEVKIGSHVPAFCTALGKVLLAYGNEETRDDYLRRLSDIAVGTPHRVPSVGELRKELVQVVAKGHAEDTGEYSPDVECVAAPVLNSKGRAIAAVSVSGPATRFAAKRESIIPMVEIAGRELTLLIRELGDDNPPL